MKDDAQELSDALDLEYWFEREGRGYKIGRGASGMQINAKECPHCGDRRSRTYLNAETGWGNCFVCGQKFSKLSFINTALGVSWADTFRHVREVLAEQGWRPRRTIAAAVDHGDIKIPLSFPLPTPEGQNLVYLETRGISAELAKYFGLRMCIEGWWRFLKEDGSQGGQLFQNRLIIPVYDLDGKLVNFQGRDVIGDQEPKYLFPITLPGTGRFLLNGQNVGNATQIVVGEGFFDLAAIKIAFDEDATLRDIVPIATFGKHLSYGSLDGNDQLGRFLRLKRQGLEEVTLMWDGTSDALVAALDAADILTRAGLRTFIALLPAGKDPNEVLPEVVREAFWKRQLYTASLSVKWRLRNPYACRK